MSAATPLGHTGAQFYIVVGQVEPPGFISESSVDHPCYGLYSGVIVHDGGSLCALAKNIWLRFYTLGVVWTVLIL